METLAIGERKVFTDVTLEVVLSRNGGCSGCWFLYQPNTCFNHTCKNMMGYCASWDRTDHKDVIFKAIDTPPSSPMAGKKCRIGGKAD